MSKGLKSKLDVQFVEVKTKDLMERGKVKGGKVGWRLGGEMGVGMGGGFASHKTNKNRNRHERLAFIGVPTYDKTNNTLFLPFSSGVHFASSRHQKGSTCYCYIVWIISAFTLLFKLCLPRRQ